MANRYTRTGVNKECIICHKEFYVMPYDIDKRRYCSHGCYNQDRHNSNTKGWFKDGHKDLVPHLARKEAAKKMVGHKLSDTSKNKIRGKNNWNWKGGVTSTDRLERVRFSNSMQMKILKRDNFTCQICGQYSGNLQVDHIKSWKDYPKLRFEVGNCRTLCMACHYYVTFKRKIPTGIVWGHNLSRRTEK